MTVIAVDPGPEESAWVLFDGQVREFGKESNQKVIELLRRERLHGTSTYKLVIEQIKSYGMAVGEEVFNTCIWTGRFMEAYGDSWTVLVPRIEVKKHLCHNAQAKDSNIRQAIIDRFGGKDRAIGRKSSRGPLYGISADVWQALALAITYRETHLGEQAA